MSSKSKWSLRGLIADALKHARMLCEDAEHKVEITEETVDVFVTSWIIPPLEAALKKATKKPK